MTLVTGIEAIQSGKPFKLVDDADWTLPDSIIGQVTPKELLDKIWVIKEEPREFWINIDTGEILSMDCLSSADIRADNWIRVREIEK